MFTPAKATAAATSSHAPATTWPRSRHTPARPEASGAANAAQCPMATARSMAITVPRKPQVIRAACASAACPSHCAPAVAGTITPTRSKPPAMPASSDAATSAMKTGVPTMRASDTVGRLCKRERAITTP